LDRVCKFCKVAIGRDYLANPDNRRHNIERGIERRLANRAYVIGIREAGSCVDCGDRCEPGKPLEFDHVIPNTKFRIVTDMLSYSGVRLDAEIGKCVLRCNGCHIERTRREGHTTAWRTVRAV
jgi:hypothetical protein